MFAVQILAKEKGGHAKAALLYPRPKDALLGSKIGAALVSVSNAHFHMHVHNLRPADNRDPLAATLVWIDDTK